MTEEMEEPEGELVRHLTAAFLMVHGKLYTKIGIDDLERSEGRLLKLWRRWLQEQLGPEAAHRMVKMAVINICSIHHSPGASDSESGQSYYFNLAFEVAAKLALETVDHAVSSLSPGGEGAESTSDPGGWLEGVSMVLPGVRVWVEWLGKQETLWSPLLSPQNRTHLGVFLVQLKKFVSSFQTQITVTTPAADCGPEWAGLWEDGMLMGFMPLKADISTETSLATPPLHKLTTEQMREQDIVRLGLLSRMCDSLSSHAHFDEVGGASVEEERHEDEVEGGDASESGDDVMVEGYSEEEEEEGEGRDQQQEVEGNPNIEKLKAQKERLSMQIRQYSQTLTTTQTVLQEAAASGDGEKEMLVCARYLVPDTNGFVDQLPNIRVIVECGHFVVAVPLVVVAELEGLSKGTAELGEKEGERGRGDRVMTGARAAVGYIREVMGPVLQVLTTRGNLLKSLSFTAELTSKATNDDLILQSSISLQRKQAPPTTSSAPHTVVLLTDDRNLRVKAHAARLPVKDIPHFMTISRLL